MEDQAALSGEEFLRLPNSTDSGRKGGTNAHFSTHDPRFLAACERAGVKPTRRQASKFRAKRGRAYAERGAK